MVNPHGLYIPMNRMGINASSDEKELAQEFIETMLSDEIQQQEFMEGLPVRTESLDKQADIAEKGGQEDLFSIDSAMGKCISYGYPSRDQIAPILDLAKGRRHTAYHRSVSERGILDCANQYFGGTISSGRSSENIG